MTENELSETGSTLSSPSVSKVEGGKLDSSCLETRKNLGSRLPGKRSQRIESEMVYQTDEDYYREIGQVGRHSIVNKASAYSAK